MFPRQISQEEAKRLGIGRGAWMTLGEDGIRFWTYAKEIR